MNLLFGEGHFDCSGCGNCCRAKWTIRVEPTKADRLRSLSPSLAIVDGVLPKEGGQCVFLDPAQRCQVHRDKPLDCQVFPFVLTPTPEGLQVRLSHYCPSVRAAKGRPLCEYAEQIADLAAQAKLPLTLSGPYVLWRQQRVGWSGYKVWESELLRRLESKNPEVVLFGALKGLHAKAELWGKAPVEELFLDCGRPPKTEGAVRLQELAGLTDADGESDCRAYLKSLIQGKFLLKQPSILTGLAILSVLPRVLATSDFDSGVARLEMLLTHDAGHSRRELADLGATLIMELCPSRSKIPLPPKDQPPTQPSTPARE